MLTPRSVYRKYVTDGVPSSGFNDPKKDEIIQLLERMEATGGQAVTKNTLGALQAVTPPNENYAGLVLSGAEAGYYYRSGGAWVFGRAFPDTAARLVGVAGSANAITASTQAGVSPSTAVLMFFKPRYRNTGAATLAINGASPRPLVAFNGEPLQEDYLIAGATVPIYDDGEKYRLLFDHRWQTFAVRAESAAESAEADADRSSQEADRSKAEADRAAGYASDAATAGNVPIYATAVGIAALNIPPGINAFRTNGYYAAGDGGAALYKEGVDAVGALESADGRWWELAERGAVSAIAFGVRLGADVDNTEAITAALQFSGLTGTRILQPVGECWYDGELVIPDGASWHCPIAYAATIKKRPGNLNRALVTKNFDALKGTSDGYAAAVPKFIELQGLVFDGNYMTAARASYVNISGGGLFIFARRMNVDIVIQNQAGIGWYSELPSGNPSPLDLGFSPHAHINLRVDTTKEEGIIWKGPGDVEIGFFLQWNAGARIASEQLAGKVSSPTYGAVNGGYTDGVVFEKGAEIGLIHAFGNYAGGGITVYNGRFNADLLIAESCHFGGIHLVGGLGQIDRLDVHRVGGFLNDTRPDIFYDASGSGNTGYRINQISNFNINPPSGRGPCNRIEIGNNARYLQCSLWEVKSNGRAGHGLVIRGGANFIQMRGGVASLCQGTADDGLPSSAVFRDGGAASLGMTVHIEAEIIQCDVAFRSVGTTQRERIALQFMLIAGQLPFAGDLRTLPGQDWDISGTVGAGNGSSNWVGNKRDLAFTFNSTLTTEQTVTLAHGLIGIPAFGKIQATLVDIGTSVRFGDHPQFFVAGYDATSVTVKYKQDVATGSDSVPRVWVHCEA